MVRDWLRKIFGIDQPVEPTPLQRYRDHCATSPNDNGPVVTELLFKMFDRYGGKLDVEYLLTTQIESRYRNIDDLLYAFRTSNSQMLERQKIEYGALRKDSVATSLDNYFVSNEGYLVNPEEAVQLLRQCFDLYQSQVDLFFVDRTDLYSYYLRVYTLYIEELNGVLRHVLKVA